MYITKLNAKSNQDLRSEIDFKFNLTIRNQKGVDMPVWCRCSSQESVKEDRYANFMHIQFTEM